MDPDFLFIVPYECPRCHASLEARVNGPPEWLRCPSCGRASMPPELVRKPPRRVEEETFVIGPSLSTVESPPIRPRAMAPRPAIVAPKGQTTRLMLGTGLFLTTFLLLLSLLETDRTRTILFGVGAVVFLFLLVRPSGADREISSDEVGAVIRRSRP